MVGALFRSDLSMTMDPALLAFSIFVFGAYTVQTATGFGSTLIAAAISLIVRYSPQLF
jgi:hypothetical protein